MFDKANRNRRLDWNPPVPSTFYCPIFALDFFAQVATMACPHTSVKNKSSIVAALLIIERAKFHQKAHDLDKFVLKVFFEKFVVKEV